MFMRTRRENPCPRSKEASAAHATGHAYFGVPKVMVDSPVYLW
jgi:hypothetical protein